MNDRTLEDWYWEESQERWAAEARRQAEQRYQQLRDNRAKVYAGKPGAPIPGTTIDETHNWKHVGWIAEDGFDLGNQYARELPAIGGGTVTLILDPSMDRGGYRIIQGKPADKHPPAHPPYRGLTEAIQQATR